MPKVPSFSLQTSEPHISSVPYPKLLIFGTLLPYVFPYLSTLNIKQANCQHIMVFTDSMGSAHRAVDPSIHAGQAFSLSVCHALQGWFEADDLRCITFVYVPSALRWDIHGEAHKYITELKVRVGHRKTDNSIDTLRSRAAHSALDSWNSTFQDPTYRGSEFLELQQPDGRLIQPLYLDGGPWLSTFRHSITEFARVYQ
ncbi:unnamed protein product [Cyclocybe aegerita]|uniref:Uncharacterized protein n=1 Tax=Cyclocybe aegerita TaxID=1973307 RepID=A0A8S0W935_CYCAE|nr:unnamed protein product [Cyclocybe aegerita]